MKKGILIGLWCVFAFGNVNAQSPSWGWAKQSVDTASEWSYGITIDTINNFIYSAGTFNGPLMVIGTTTLTSNGLEEIFLAKYDLFGNPIWAKSFGGAKQDNARKIEVDPSGNIYLTGIFGSTTISFGSTTFTLGGLGSGNMFIAKFDPSGNLIWGRQIIADDDDIGDMKVDKSGNSYITGYFGLLPITIGSYSLSLYSGLNMFLAKYDNTGNVLWAKCAGSTGNEEPLGLAVDNLNGDVCVVGTFYSTSMTIGSYTLVNTDTLRSDIFIIKYNNAGNLIWAKGEGGSGWDEANSVAFDPNGTGDIYIGGDYTSPTINFGGNIITNAQSNGIRQDMFLTKFNYLGNVLWAEGLGGVGDDGIGDIGILPNASNNIYVSGGFSASTLATGPSTIINSGTNSTMDIFVAKFDKAGNPQWGISAGGMNTDQAEDLSLGTVSSGNIYICGEFNSSNCVFGTTTTLLNPSNSWNNADFFMAKINSPDVGIEELSNDSKYLFYPNPSTGQINIYYSEKIDEIKVSDLLGQIVYQSKPNKQQETIQIEKSGIYFITLNSGEKSVNKKIIVNR